MLYLDINPDLKTKFPGLLTLIIRVKEVKVKPLLPELEKFKIEVTTKVMEKWSLDQLREHPVFKAYRSFFWRVGVDPTKSRPAAEALIRRVLRERPIPKINSLVDSYNLASIISAIPIAAFDEDLLIGSLTMREARVGEEFLGIGMKKPVILDGGEPVIQDEEKLIAIYPYRDAESCKVTTNTKNVLMLICGVPGIEEEKLIKTGEVSVEVVTRFCGGARA